MKIVSWNCNGAFRRKYERISTLCADVYVIQECENPAYSTQKYQDWAGSYLWAGSNTNKGIGVFVKNGLSLNLLDWPDHGLQQFLPVRIDEQLNLVAVWTKRGQTGNMTYIGQFWQYMNYHSKFWNDETIICGDFNSNVMWDKFGRIWNHSECVKNLGELGLHSYYHLACNEKHGSETRPTLYLQRNLSKPYHVDYIFARESRNPSGAISLYVGRAEDWLMASDHMPIAVEI